MTGTSWKCIKARTVSWCVLPTIASGRVAMSARSVTQAMEAKRSSFAMSPKAVAKIVTACPRRRSHIARSRVNISAPVRCSR